MHLGSKFVFYSVVEIQRYLTINVSALQLDGNISNYLVDLGHFLGQESHDFPGLIIIILTIYTIDLYLLIEFVVV